MIVAASPVSVALPIVFLLVVVPIIFWILQGLFRGIRHRARRK